ncbi:MAG TPA: ANTAR domain-containing protein [Streptosporangiaceae bacterium]|nr:ANTAR domain-containing protein [Streptosporangiaceae bacterium]
MSLPEHGTQIAAAFAELADTLASDLDIDTYLTSVCRHCVRLTRSRGAAITYTATTETASVNVASSDAQSHQLARGSPDASPSPWGECMSTGMLIAVDLRSGPDRWPWFTNMAINAGFAAVTVVPVSTQTAVVGALALLGRAIPDLADIQLARSLADAAGAGIAVSSELRRQELTIAHLQSALTSRIVIEQAKGILAERWKLTPDEAFHQLRKQARRTQRRLPELAVAVIEGSSEVNPAEPVHRNDYSARQWSP